ncbi:TPA: hypothetical protein QCX03_003916 [Bacillus cytotoxicus]|nr:hypothetical protein [Bacillus cytotoxicus]
MKQRWTKLTEYINGIDRDMKKLIKIVSTKLGYVNNSYWSCELFVIPGQTYTLKYKTTNQLGLTVTENDEYLVWEEKKSHDKVTTFIPKTNKITLQFYGLGTFDYLLLRGNQKD